MEVDMFPMARRSILTGGRNARVRRGARAESDANLTLMGKTERYDLTVGKNGI